MTLVLEIVPFALLGAIGLFLAGNWSAIPASFPVHWGLDGEPNGWATRSGVGVYGPVVLGAAVCGLALAVRRAAGRRTSAGQWRNYQRRVLLGAEHVVAATFGATALLPLAPRPGWVISVAVVGAGLLLLLAVVGAVRLGRAQAPPPAERCWRWGIVYVNREDRAIFVPKRFGFGLTLNFGRRAAWVVLALLLGVPIAAAVAAAMLM